jgi:amino acid adenylation domain-containing protein
MSGIHQLFIDTANRYPQSIALVQGESKYTYSELNQRSNQFAHSIMSLNLSKNSVIGISLERGFDLIAAMLGILKAGHAYLPLDKNYPLDRLQYMCEHSQAQLLISDHDKIKGIKQLDLASLSTNIDNVSAEEFDLAYVIYTSGSTGRPKGVMLGHLSLMNLLNHQANESKYFRTLQFTPISFDVHFQEIFSTLTTGATLVLINEDDRLDFSNLLDKITKHKVERIFLPFVALNKICEIANLTEKYPQDLKEVTTAGEQLRITQEIKKFFLKTKAELFNHYGPSETHVVTSYKMPNDLDQWEVLPPIGSLLVGNEMLVLDEKQNISDSGELLISGKSVGYGYINDLERTKEKFITLNGKVFYKTGDLVELRGDTIYYLGRLDSQVKLRGHRIELGEIDSLIEKELEHAQVCTQLFHSEKTEDYLCSYIQGDFDPKQLRESLTQLLPDYMVPRFIVSTDKLPLTPSGKIDRKALRAPKFVRPELQNIYVPAKTKTEKWLKDVWSELLGIDDIGIQDKFFDLGGTSLLAMNLLFEINQELNFNLNIADLFDLTCIQEIAQFLDDKTSGDDKSESIVEVESHKNQGNSHDIAIIAMTGRFPGANSVESLWEMLLNKQVGIKDFDPSNIHPSVKDSHHPNYVFKQGRIDGFKSFDASFFGITPREAELMDPQQRKFLELSYEALELSGINPNNFKGDIGIFAGSANNTYQENLRDFPDKVATLGDFNVMLANEKDYLATRVAYKLGLTGPAISLNTGCSTSLVAVVQAVQSLRNKECDAALAGGIAISGQDNVGHLHITDSIKSKDGLCRAYDADASGTIFTDGAGIIVLKRLEDALQDGDLIQAVIKGVGLNNDGKDKMSFSAPSVKGQAGAISKAIADANCSLENLKYIEGHGTGTPIGDPIELSALSRSYKNLNHKVYLGSLKSNIGHLTASAGVAGLIKAALVVKNKTIVPTAHFKTANKKMNISSTPFEVNSEVIELEDDFYAGVSSFGVGGTNAHVILAPAPKNNIKKSDENTLFCLSHKNESQLLKMQDSFDRSKIHNTLNVSSTLLKREAFKYRSYRTLESKWKTDKIQTFKKVIFMFPGQGAQYIEMGKQLSERFPRFKETMDYCFDQLRPLLKNDLRNVLYNSPDSEESQLNNTYYTQPAIFVFEYALAKLLEEMGVVADEYIGHSVGELCAATLNGVFSLEDALKIIAKRSELMSSLPGGDMLTVLEKKEEVEKLLNSLLQIAAINSSDSTVVAGPTNAVNEFIKKLDELGISSKKLHTSHAFHSEMMRPMLDEFKSYLDNISKNIPNKKMISTVTTQYEKELFLSSDYWAKHILNPVLFAPTIKKLIDDKTLFIEIGPRVTLKSLSLKEALTNKVKIKALSTGDRNPTNELNAFISLLGELNLCGIEVDLRKLNRSDTFQTEAIALTQFETKEHWLDKKIENNKNITIETDKKMQTNDSMDYLKTKIAEIFDEASGIDITEFSDDTCFFEMGMDSLFLTQIATQLKNEFKHEISFRQLTEELADLKSLCTFFLDKVDIPQSNIVANTTTPVESTAQVDNISRVETTTPVNNTNQVQMVQPITNVTTTGVEGIIQTQLQIMQNQLNLLAGAGVQVSTPKAETKTPEVEPEKVIDKVKSHNETHEKNEHSLKAKLNNTKEAFGAIARISTEKKELNNEFIKNLINEYQAQTKSSKAFTQEGRRDHADPRAVTGFKPEHKEIVYPIVVKESKDQTMIDLDGNEYIDMLCGFGSNFFGNSNKHIADLIKKQIDTGMEIGPQHPLTLKVAKLINELTGNERSAFCNTGSEAVLGAMRIARTISGKKKIISFNGAYHGINDEVIIRGSKKGRTYPAAPGINAEAVGNMIVLEYGCDDSLETLKELIKSDEIAAVIVEPVQSRRCDFHPKEYLKTIRDITEKKDICLIFDEVITGFRIALGGAQEYFGIRADICTYGKIVGGGMPIGVVSGKAKYLDALDGGHWQYGDDSTPTVGVTYFAGTFVRHPLALAAALGALEILKSAGKERLDQLNKTANAWCEDINHFCAQLGAPIKFANFGGLMKPKWEGGDYQYSDLFFAYLRKNGVHCYDGFPWFINLAHTDKQLEKVKSVIKKAIANFQSEGLMISNGLSEKVVRSDNPPRSGAKLGRNANGEACWFIKNENGEYQELN